MFIETFDLPIMRFLNGFVGRSDTFDHFVYGLSYFDTFKGVAVISLLWLAWFHRPAKETAQQQEARQIHLLIVFAGSLVTVIFSRVLQLLLHVHQRPILAGLGLKYPAFIDPETVNTWNCFPSDHSMLFFALATGLWQTDRRLGIIGFFWAIIMVDLPRVYIGYHYPSDVAAGAVLGILCMLGFERLPIRSLAKRTLAWSKIHPGMFYWIAFIACEQTGHLFDDVRRVGHQIIDFMLGRM